MAGVQITVAKLQLLYSLGVALPRYLYTVVSATRASFRSLLFELCKHKDGQEQLLLALSGEGVEGVET